MSYLSPDAKKLAITYICTGKYNIFFKEFYESFKSNFCPGNQLTFVVLTDIPNAYNSLPDTKVYDIQRRYKSNDINFIKFRKWRDILLAEDFLSTQDYCFYINSNLTCPKQVTLQELFNGKDQYAVYHSLFDINRMPMYESLSRHPKCAAFFDAMNKIQYPNYRYYQAGNVGAISEKFLKMCSYIESCRYFDCFYGLSNYVPWHDETYYNKYINGLVKKDPNSINILDGKYYLCTWLHELDNYRPNCKMLLKCKESLWQSRGM